MNKYFKTLLAASVIVGFSSCLKDKGFENNEYGLTNVESGKVIELAFQDEQAHVDNKAIDFLDSSITLSFLTVRLAAKDPAPEDITVTIDTTGSYAQIVAYNIANEKSIDSFPTTFFSFPAGLKVTIKKGDREATLPLTTNASQFDPSSTYGIYFHIASVDKPGYTISGNFGTFLTTIGAKNKYDGSYKIRGHHNRTSPNYSYPYSNIDIDLITVGASSVALYLPDASDFGIPIGIGPGANDWSYYGSLGPILKFDPATNNLIGVTDYFGSVPFFLGPVPGQWNPSTKEIQIQFYYNTSGTATFATRGYSDTLTYVGPR